MPERRSATTRFASLALALTTAAWPLLAYASAGSISPRAMALGICLLLLARLWLSGRGALVYGAAAIAVMALVSCFGDHAWLSVKLYPCAVSAALLLVFGASLLRPPTVIERIARFQDPALPAEGVAYTRAVTVAWCAFFICNGSVAAFTAFHASDRVWALYNGVIAYGLMGAMFGGEMLIRRHAMARMARPSGGGAGVMARD